MASPVSGASDPRPARDCLVCSTPLSGLYGGLARLAGVRRTRQNPSVCNRCNGHIEEGSIVELSVLFADLTGYTRLTHDLGPERTHRILDGFRRMASDVVLKWDGSVAQFPRGRDRRGWRGAGLAWASFSPWWPSRR